MIVIQTLYAGGSPCGVFCKGKPSDDDFLAAVREYDRDQDEENAEMIEPGMIKHATIRYVPYRGSKTDLLRLEDGVYFHASKPGRGAFDITYVDFEDAIEF